MTWQPQKNDVLDELTAEILHNYGKSRAIIAIDGVDGAGKTHFADDLAEAFKRANHPVLRASIDDFNRPRADRQARGADSPEAFYRDKYDYDTFRRVLIDPFRAGGSGSFVLAAFDAVKDAPIPSKWITGKPDTTLIIDGIFLNRPELRGLWNYSVWLDAPAEVVAERLLERDGVDGWTPKHADAQALYEREAKPRTSANAIIDNSDFEHPRRVFADSC